MSRELALAILAIMAIALLVFGHLEAGAFIVLAAVLVALFAPTKEQRDARRRNR